MEIGGRVQGSQSAALTHIRSGLCLHYFPEGSLEFCHLLLRPYGDSDPSGHDRPDAAYHDVLFGHGVADFLARTLHVDHEAVGFGRDVSKPLRSSHWNVCWRTLALMWRRSATNAVSRRLAVAATTPVMGMKFHPPRCTTLFARSGRAINSPQRMPAMP